MTSPVRRSGYGSLSAVRCRA